MSRTAPSISAATSLVVCSAQIGAVLTRIVSAAASARRAWPPMLRAVSQIAISSAAATSTIAAPTAIQRRQAAQSSASLIGVLPACAVVEVVAPVPGAVAAPEPVLLPRRASRLLRAQVLPDRVEELDRAVGNRLRLHVSPAARDLLTHVPAVLAGGL